MKTFLLLLLVVLVVSDSKKHHKTQLDDGICKSGDENTKQDYYYCEVHHAFTGEGETCADFGGLPVSIDGEKSRKVADAIQLADRSKNFRFEAF